MKLEEQVIWACEITFVVDINISIGSTFVVKLNRVKNPLFVLDVLQCVLFSSFEFVAKPQNCVKKSAGKISI